MKGSGATKTKAKGARGSAWRGAMESGGGVSKSGAWRGGRDEEKDRKKKEEGREGESGRGHPKPSNPGH